MANCANWLDVVQFEFESTPSDFEVIEARVFEHQSRSLLSQIDPAFGWRMVAPNLLQVYGLGKELPTRLDIWLRANSYRSEDKASVVRLQAGKKQPVSGGVILLKAVQSGFEGWSSRSGFLQVKEVDASITALDLLWIATPQSPEPYQVAAVSIDGQKQFNDTYLSRGGNSDQRTVAMFDFPIDEISHLEIRPQGGRHRFFFDGAKVPKVAGRFFAPAPLVTVPVEQREGKTVVSELAPLKVAITLGNGDQVTGSRANETVARVLRRVIPENVGKAFSVISEVEGIAAIPLTVRLIDSQNGVIVTSPMGMHRATNATSSSSSETFPLPIQLVESIEVSLQPKR
jgi:hypothetical protein